MKADAADDARVVRTRMALLGAFNMLLLRHGYDAVRPGSIAARAGVARSTFYEHFAGKAALLQFSMTTVLLPIARACRDDRLDDGLAAVVQHFWDNRRLARAVLSGRPRVLVQQRLAELVEAELRQVGAPAIVPLPLVAETIAHGQLGLIDAWLCGRSACAASDVARAVQASAHSAAAALVAFRG